MGFFSWKCVECNHSILHPLVVTPELRWMTHVVVYCESGEFIQGLYDGYGRVDTSQGTVELEGIDVDKCLRHRACWEAAGKPKYTKASPSAPDQGHFFDREKYLRLKNPMEGKDEALQDPD